MTPARKTAAAVATLVLICAPAAALVGQKTLPGQATLARPTLRTWLGREPEIERVHARGEDRADRIGSDWHVEADARIAPGGPVESAAWKTQPPGTHRGFPDNYKAEVAATSSTSCWIFAWCLRR